MKINDRIASPGRSRGVVLFIALIVLVTLTIGALALMRSVGTSTLIAANLSFRQSALHASDKGVEGALAWLTTQGNAGTIPSVDNPAIGYYATWQDGFDPANYDWSTKAQYVETDDAGNDIRYVIHRMCQTAGALSTSSCLTSPSISTSGITSQTTLDYTKWNLATNSTGTYYRVTVRVAGPRNTFSYVQAMLY